MLSGLLKVHAVEIDTSLKLTGLVAGLLTSHPYNVSRFWSDEFAQLLTEVLRKQHFDIVQFEGSYLAIYSETVRKATKAKLILRSHNVEHIIWSRLAKSEKNGLKRFYLNNLSPKIADFERRHVHDFDGIIPIASQDTQWYKGTGFKGKLQTITGGVDLERFKQSTQQGISQKVAFLGSLEWLPNVQGLDWFVAKVWPEVVRRYPHAEFHIAGKNPAAGYMANAGQGIRMHGMVADAAEFLATCGIFMVPLFSGGGMRMKVLEAMGAGMRVLSTAVGAEGIDCKHGADIWLAEGIQEWIDGLCALLEGDLPEMGMLARSKMEQAYGWEAIGAQFDGFYWEALA